jgi:hypothetical protein
MAPLRGIPLNQLVLLEAGIEDLSPLRGMPLEVLELQNCRSVKDLGPLRELPLRRLGLGSPNGEMQVSDLEPLRDMRLESLSIHRSKVASLEPLRGMRLAYLGMQLCHASDLEPLRGMPLKRLVGCGLARDLDPLRDTCLELLDIRGAETQVESLEPLRQLPLRHLNIAFTTRIQDLRPLAELKLESLGCNLVHVQKYPDLLQRMKSLKTITVEHKGTFPAEEFWKRYDAGEFKK